ncbi:MAG: CPBP family intramembrane glutamic endopeptidase [bacterium]
MSLFPPERYQKRSFFTNLYIPAIGAAIIILYPSYHQVTDFHLWYLFPLWIILGHILCSLSYTITGISVKKGIIFFINSFAVYGENRSLIYLQTAFLTSFLEEAIFRYFLLFYLKDLLRSPILAIFLSSLIFTAYHLHLGWKSESFMRYLDLFIFSSIIGTANIITRSFYPAFILHGMRNYILRCLLVSKEEYEARKKKRAYLDN